VRPTKTEEVVAQGRRVRWRTTGAGPPLVLVHGLSGSARWWASVSPTLAERYETHLLDLPPFGSALQPDRVSEWLAVWADTVGIRRLRLAGHSLGGAAAAGLAAAEPDRVEALALVAPTGIRSGRRLVGYALPLVTALRDAGPAFVATLALDALRGGPESLVRGALYASGADIRERARSIRAPTLLVWGARDPLVPPALAEEWQRAIPHARLVTLAGVGHVPMVERPDELAAVLRDFFDESCDDVGGGPVRGVRSAGDDGETAAR